MRKLVLQQGAISLDGYICEEGSEFWRSFGPFSLPPAPDDDEYEELYLGRLRQAGTHIMGRVTYLSMAQTWPGSADPVAAIMNDVPKVVFSRTLTVADWPQSRIASGDTAAEIARLKAEPGGEIVAHGGARFAQSLTRLGLVDEYRLYVHPVATGPAPRCSPIPAARRACGCCPAGYFSAACSRLPTGRSPQASSRPSCPRRTPGRRCRSGWMPPGPAPRRSQASDRGPGRSRIGGSGSGRSDGAANST